MGQEQFKFENVRLDQKTTEPGHAVEQHPDRLIGTILDGKIKIVSLVGRGGMSVVYKGVHAVLNRTVAVKVIFPGPSFNDTAVLRLQQEAKAAYSLSHKNLASVHDVSVTSDGLPYLVMDFAGGITLSEILQQGPLEPTQAIEIFSQICAGLEAAHSQGVIHRDIKPGNIMVEQLAGGGEIVKIVDFGIAKKVTENADEIQRLTQTGEVFGTPLYMSPEQCRGEKLDRRSDIYSLGCVFYETLTGVPPFKGESSIATILQHLSKEAPNPDKDLKLSRPLVSVLHRCMEKRSQDRYQSVDELRQDLQAIKDGGKTAKTYVKKRQISSATKISILMAGLAVISLAATLFFAFNGQNKQIETVPSGYDTIQSCNGKLANNPHDLKALMSRGLLFFRQAKATEALTDFSQVITLNKNFAPAYL